MRGQQDPLCRQVLGRIEALQDVRRRHRADGVVTPEEDAIEGQHVVELVCFTADADESQAIGQAIARNGFECGHAQRLIRQRASRKGHRHLYLVDVDVESENVPELPPAA